MGHARLTQVYNRAKSSIEAGGQIDHDAFVTLLLRKFSCDFGKTTKGLVAWLEGSNRWTVDVGLADALLRRRTTDTLLALFPPEASVGPKTNRAIFGNSTFVGSICKGLKDQLPAISNMGCDGRHRLHFDDGVTVDFSKPFAQQTRVGVRADFNQASCPISWFPCVYDYTIDILNVVRAFNKRWENPEFKLSDDPELLERTEELLVQSNLLAFLAAGYENDVEMTMYELRQFARGFAGNTTCRDIVVYGDCPRRKGVLMGLFEHMLGRARPNSPEGSRGYFSSLIGNVVLSAAKSQMQRVNLVELDLRGAKIVAVEGPAQTSDVFNERILQSWLSDHNVVTHDKRHVVEQSDPAWLVMSMATQPVHRQGLQRMSILRPADVSDADVVTLQRKYPKLTEEMFLFMRILAEGLCSVQPPVMLPRPKSVVDAVAMGASTSSDTDAKQRAFALAVLAANFEPLNVLKKRFPKVKAARATTIDDMLATEGVTDPRATMGQLAYEYAPGRPEAEGSTSTSGRVYRLHGVAIARIPMA